MHHCIEQKEGTFNHFIFWLGLLGDCISSALLSLILILVGWFWLGVWQLVDVGRLGQQDQVAVLLVGAKSSLMTSLATVITLP